jgi:hypothetical protein
VRSPEADRIDEVKGPRDKDAKQYCSRHANSSAEARSARFGFAEREPWMMATCMKLSAVSRRMRAGRASSTSPFSVSGGTSTDTPVAAAPRGRTTLQLAIIVMPPFGTMTHDAT